MKPTDLEKLHQNAGTASQLLKALSHPQRLLLLCQLVPGERSVGELETLCGLPQPNLSQQLGVLRREALISPRKEGKQVYYRLTDPKALAILETLYQLYCEEQP